MLKEVLDNLAPDLKRRLMYAFENELTQYIELDNLDFIGVNVGHLKHLQISESAGLWSYGKVKKQC